MVSYACLAIFGPCMLLTVAYGVLNTNGVVQNYLVDQLEKSVNSVGWISAIAVSFFQIIGFIAGGLTTYFGHRLIAVLGGTLMFCGQILSYYATDIYQYIISIGFVTGFGIGCCYNSAFTSISVYFDKYFKIANGLVAFGITFGILLFPVLMELLIESYGYKGAKLILAAICLHVLIVAALFRPSHCGTKIYKHIEGGKQGNGCSPCVGKFYSAFNIQFLKENPGLFAFMLSCACKYISYMTWVAYAIPNAIALGSEPLTAATLATFFGIGNLLGRLCQICSAVFCTNRPLTEYTFGIIIGIGCLVIFAMSSTFTFLAMSSFTYGVSLGIALPLDTVMLRQLSPSTQFPLVVGVSSTCTGVSIFCFEILFGWVHDLTGSYRCMFVILILIQLLAVSIIMFNSHLRGLLPFFNRPSQSHPSTK